MVVVVVGAEVGAGTTVVEGLVIEAVAVVAEAGTAAVVELGSEVADPQPVTTTRAVPTTSKRHITWPLPSTVHGTAAAHQRQPAPPSSCPVSPIRRNHQERSRRHEDAQSDGPPARRYQHHQKDSLHNGHCHEEQPGAGRSPPPARAAAPAALLALAQSKRCQSRHPKYPRRTAIAATPAMQPARCPCYQGMPRLEPRVGTPPYRRARRRRSSSTSRALDRCATDGSTWPRVLGGRTPRLGLGAHPSHMAVSAHMVGAHRSSGTRRSVRCRSTGPSRRWTGKQRRNRPRRRGCAEERPQ